MLDIVTCSRVINFFLCVVHVLQVSTHLELFNIEHQLLSGISQLKKIKNQKIQIRKQ